MYVIAYDIINHTEIIASNYTDNNNEKLTMLQLEILNSGSDLFKCD